MFEWQIALGVELVVILLGLGLWLGAANAGAGPRTFVKVAATGVIVFTVLLAGCTVTKAILNYLDDDEDDGGSTFFLIFAEEKEEPRPALLPLRTPSGKTTGLKEPLPEWKGDLQKKKWHERGEMMKKKWAERGA